MTITNRLKAAENLPVLSPEAFRPSSRLTFGLKPIFVGPNGLRAGSRLQASDNGNSARHVQLPCNMLPPHLCLLFAVTFSTPTPDNSN